jgi:hypothetical protein
VQIRIRAVACCYGWHDLQYISCVYDKCCSDSSRFYPLYVIVCTLVAEFDGFSEKFEGKALRYDFSFIKDRLCICPMEGAGQLCPTGCRGPPLPRCLIDDYLSHGGRLPHKYSHYYLLSQPFPTTLTTVEVAACNYKMMHNPFRSVERGGSLGGKEGERLACVGISFSFFFR